MKLSHYVILVTFIFASCSSSTQNQDKTEAVKEEPKSSALASEYMVKFTKIDNVAYVEVDDSLIYTSGFTYGGENDIDYRVDLTDYVTNGAEKITIGLINGVEPYTDQTDAHWEIMFDLVLEGEVVDFIHEIKLENELGYVYKVDYIIDDWSPSLN